MANGQPISNRDYDLVSIVYHAAQGAETVRQYAKDAGQGGQGGQQDVGAFFQEALQQYERLAQRGLELLRRSGQGG